MSHVQRPWNRIVPCHVHRACHSKDFLMAGATGLKDQLSLAKLDHHQFWWQEGKTCLYCCRMWTIYAVNTLCVYFNLLYRKDMGVACRSTTTITEDERVNMLLTDWVLGSCWKDTQGTWLSDWHLCKSLYQCFTGHKRHMKYNLTVDIIQKKIAHWWSQQMVLGHGNLKSRILGQPRILNHFD